MRLAHIKKVAPKYFDHNPILYNNHGNTVAIILIEHNI